MTSPSLGSKKMSMWDTPGPSEKADLTLECARTLSQFGDSLAPDPPQGGRSC